jgi:hypothetical protein
MVQHGVEIGLLPSPSGALDVRTIPHVRLPDLLGEFGLKFFALWANSEQLLGSQASAVEKTVDGEMKSEPKACNKAVPVR